MKDENLDEQVILSSGSSKYKGPWVERSRLLRNEVGGAISYEAMNLSFVHSEEGNHWRVLGGEVAIVLKAAWRVDIK